MTYTVAITRQGQISIPAALRELLGFSVPGTAIIRHEGRKATIEPVRDIFSLRGMLHDSIPKHLLNLPVQKAIKLEKEAAIRAHVARYEKSLH